MKDFNNHMIEFLQWLEIQMPKLTISSLTQDELSEAIDALIDFKAVDPLFTMKNNIPFHFIPDTSGKNWIDVNLHSNYPYFKIKTAINRFLDAKVKDFQPLDSYKKDLLSVDESLRDGMLQNYIITEVEPNEKLKSDLNKYKEVQSTLYSLLYNASKEGLACLDSNCPLCKAGLSSGHVQIAKASVIDNEDKIKILNGSWQTTQPLYFKFNAGAFNPSHNQLFLEPIECKLKGKMLTTDWIKIPYKMGDFNQELNCKYDLETCHGYDYDSDPFEDGYVFTSPSIDQVVSVNIKSMNSNEQYLYKNGSLWKLLEILNKIV